MLFELSLTAGSADRESITSWMFGFSKFLRQDSRVSPDIPSASHFVEFRTGTL